MGRIERTNGVRYDSTQFTKSEENGKTSLKHNKTGTVISFNSDAEFKRGSVKFHKRYEYISVKNLNPVKNQGNVVNIFGSDKAERIEAKYSDFDNVKMNGGDDILWLRCSSIKNFDGGKGDDALLLSDGAWTTKNGHIYTEKVMTENNSEIRDTKVDTEDFDLCHSLMENAEVNTNTAKLVQGSLIINSKLYAKGDVDISYSDVFDSIIKQNEPAEE